MTVLGIELPVITFARPNALGLLAIIPLMALIAWRAAKRRQRDVRTFGQPMGTHRPGRRWTYTVHVLTVGCLIVGIAGPQWGRFIEPGTIYGRDVVAVLDLSRSMRARDVTLDGRAIARWEAGRHALKQLADAAQRRGGHRLALVVFAGRAMTLVPLTADYDHFRRKLDEIDGEFPPPDTQPGPSAISGTRIGAAVEKAVSLVDQRFPRATDVLLVSDGDDPGGDHEWENAVRAARLAGVSLDVAGVGTDVGDPIPLDDGFVEVNGIPVITKLNAKLLDDIAAQTGGEFIGGPLPSLGEFFRSRIEPRPSRETEADALPRPTPRQSWFFGSALVGMIAVMGMGNRRMLSRQGKP